MLAPNRTDHRVGSTIEALRSPYNCWLRTTPYMSPRSIPVDRLPTSLGATRLAAVMVAPKYSGRRVESRPNFRYPGLGSGLHPSKVWHKNGLRYEPIWASFPGFSLLHLGLQGNKQYLHRGLKCASRTQRSTGTT